MESGSKFKSKIAGSEKDEKKLPKSVYDGLSQEQLIRRLKLEPEEEITKETPLDTWMRIYQMTREEILSSYPGKFNDDGSFKR